MTETESNKINTKSNKSKIKIFILIGFIVFFSAFLFYSFVPEDETNIPPVNEPNIPEEDNSNIENDSGFPLLEVMIIGTLLLGGYVSYNIFNKSKSNEDIYKMLMDIRNYFYFNEGKELDIEIGTNVVAKRISGSIYLFHFIGESLLITYENGIKGVEIKSLNDAERDIEQSEISKSLLEISNENTKRAGIQRLIDEGVDVDKINKVTGELDERHKGSGVIDRAIPTERTD